MKKQKEDKICVYIVSRNYGKFLKKSIGSVLAQTFKNWQLYLINDGSTDSTLKIYNNFKKRNKKKITVLNFKKSIGLQKLSNHVLKNIKTEYILRLDADDWLHECALELMFNEIKKNKNNGLVYSGYYYTNIYGKIIGVENNFDLIKNNNVPPHGACCLISVKDLIAVGGYSTEFKAQDGWDLWFKLKNKVKYKCIPLPLFYYRKHGYSLSDNYKKILKERSKIFKKNQSTDKKKNLDILAIIPVKSNYIKKKDVPFIKYKSKKLIDISIDMVDKSKKINHSIISTSDHKLINYLKQKKKISNKFQILKRSPKLNSGISRIEDVMLDSCNFFKKNKKKNPDIVVFINIHTVVKNKGHLDQVLDTLVSSGKLSTFSVIKQSDPLFVLKRKNFFCINKGRFDNLEYNNELTYRYDNSIFAFWFEALKTKSIFEKSISFKENSRDNVINIL
tara:strand:- start:953 stop:2296 length:1344 start_codon:yes stop_codon:yes gene_type:complete